MFDLDDNIQTLDVEVQEVVEIGGTYDYAELIHKPKINNVELSGNKSLSDLGIISAIDTEVATYVEAHKSELKGDKGDQGIQGVSGEDGFSPIASVAQTTNGAKITITDKNGTTITEVSNGTNGVDGQDGFSPIATVTQNVNGTKISITDKNGTTEATIEKESKDFKLIKSITLEEAVNLVSFSEDAEGNPFSIKEYIVFVYILNSNQLATDIGGNFNVRVNNHQVDWQSNNNSASSPTSIYVANGEIGKNVYIGKHSVRNNTTCTIRSHVSSNMVAPTSSANSFGFWTSSWGEYITQLSISMNTNNTLKEGVTIEFYGR